MVFPPTPPSLRPRQLVYLLALAWGSSASAQGASAPVLQEMIISGSRSAQVGADLPASIDILGAEELEQGMVRDIRDVTRDLPNVSVRRAPARMTLAMAGTGADGNAGFNIRGREGNQVLLLVDGIRVPRSYVFAATAFGRDYFDIGLVKRVEIIRGPASALYGSDGMAGLVNFITHAPEDFLQHGKTIGGRAMLGYRADDQGWSTGATVAGRANGVASWLVSAHTERAEGLDNMGTNNAENMDRTTPNPQKDRNAALLGKLVLQPNARQKHVLTFEHVKKHSDIKGLSALAKPPYAPTSTRAFNATQDMARNRASWSAQYQLDAAVADTLQTALSYQAADAQDYRFEGRHAASDRVRDTAYGEKTWQLNVQAAKTLAMGANWRHKLTYGLDYSRSKVTTLQTGLTPPLGEPFPLKRFPDSVETSVAAYLQNEIVGEHWSVTPGVRYDSFKLDASQKGYASMMPAASLSGSSVSPKLGVLFRATPQWSIFGHYAAGFKAPDASQVNAYRESGGPLYYKTSPNPHLRPEKSQNFELGLRGRSGRLSLDAAIFSGLYKDLIESVVAVSGNMRSPATALVYQSQNISKARINGFEVKGEMLWGRVGKGSLATMFAYGQAKGRNRSTGKPLDSVAPSKLNAGLRYRRQAWEARLDMAYHAAKKASEVDASSSTQFLTPAATTFDLSGQWRIRKDLRLNLGLYNLGNKKYWNWSDVRGVMPDAAARDAYTQPGRHARISLVADF